MRFWSIVAGISIALIILLGISFPRDVLLKFHIDIEAAVAQINITSLRLWQNRGGFLQEIALGARSTDVRLIQDSLGTDPNIYPEKIVSGYFGMATKRALSAFQYRYFLPATGFFDEGTRLALNKIFYNELCPTPPSTTNPICHLHT